MAYTHNPYSATATLSWLLPTGPLITSNSIDSSLPDGAGATTNPDTSPLVGAILHCWLQTGQMAHTGPAPHTRTGPPADQPASHTVVSAGTSSPPDPSTGAASSATEGGASTPSERPSRPKWPSHPSWAVSVPCYKGPTHPCLKSAEGCKFGTRCYFRDLPRAWCIKCILGKHHDRCSGCKPLMHPCLRVFGVCRYGDECAFRDFPWVWCLFCLRGQTHRTCSGIRPHTMPQTAARCQAVAECANHTHKQEKRRKW